MKKILLLLLCTVTLGLVSCEKETLIDSALPNQTIETEIRTNAWSLVDNGTRYTTTVNFPEIDDDTFRNDGILVYIYPDNGINAYKQLPYVYNAQTYSYTARRGSITIDIQTTGDQILAPVRPEATVGLRVVLVTSNLN